MNTATETPYLVKLIAHHARNVDPNFTLPATALVPEVKLCSVCAGPIDGHYDLCFQCLERARSAYGDELADAVIPLSYSVKDYPNLGQFYSDLYRYKDDRPSAPAQRRLEALITLFERLHFNCLEEEIGMSAQYVTFVPSGRGRINHPLEHIARSLAEARGIPFISSHYINDPRDKRAHSTNPEQFSIDSNLTGHLIIVEDTWVAGHNSQSLAIQAKLNGADKVSIIALARMLDYNFTQTQKMVDSWPSHTSFNPHMCPIDGIQHRRILRN